jgi:hypothetical protein
MSIPEEAWNATWHANWQDDEETTHRILEKPPWMLAIGDRTETHQKSDRLRDDLAPSLRKHVVS